MFKVESLNEILQLVYLHKLKLSSSNTLYTILHYDIADIAGKL